MSEGELGQKLIKKTPIRKYVGWHGTNKTKGHLSKNTRKGGIKAEKYTGSLYHEYYHYGMAHPTWPLEETGDWTSS